MLKRIREIFGRRDRERSPASTSPTNPEEAANEARPGGGVPAVHRGPQVVHRPIPEKDLDPEAVKIVRRLTRFDHIAYLVGGCVRDLLLDRSPKDFDIATSATPRQVKRAFRNCRIVGRRFRLAHVYFHDGKIIEVATFRAQEGGPDGDGDDAEGGRDDEDLLIRDDNVFGTPEEDALRRDFTINQLFYDLGSETVLDHAGGLEDLRRGVVRTIGDPEIRFREDPIRILRAIKFAARLDFRIEGDTLRALERVRGEIARSAPPRVLEEINRFCRGGAAVRSFELLRETRVFDVVLPEYHDAYASDGPAWDLLRDFLARIDRTVAGGGDATTGEILASLVVPLRVEPFGWETATGRATRSRGIDVRRLTDEVLRPVALRLRVSRRDQEHARQILMSLFRMVPSARVRANTRRAILGRACLPETLGMLEILGERFGGEFAEASAYWRAQAAAPGPAGAREPIARGAVGAVADEGEGEGEGQGDGTRRRRRRRRRGRGSGRSDGPAAAAGTEAATREPTAPRKPARELPPVWDDRYFFAALPTVPAGMGEADPERADPEAELEAGVVDGGAVVDGDGDAAASVEADEHDATKRRRRRRRRGGRGRSRSGDSARGGEGPGDDGNGAAD